jgi:hypothetical protein
VRKTSTSSTSKSKEKDLVFSFTTKLTNKTQQAPLQ